MRTLFLYLSVLSVFYTTAQSPIRFLTTFGGNGDDVGYSVKATLDGQYIVAGSTSSYGNGNTDVYLVKVDSVGNPVWAKFYGGFGNEVGKSVIQLPDSGYVIAGLTNSYGAGGYDAYLIRTDKSGNLLWQRTFGGIDWDFANDLVLASDGNIFVVGFTNSFGSGNKDGFLIKYDLAGNLLLQKTYGGTENEELKSIIKTNDNFLATVGYTESKGEINGDGYFMKLDLNGDTLFTKTFGGPYKDYACDLVQKSPVENNSYYLCGAKTYSPNSNTHSYMYSMSSTGAYLSDSNYFRNGGDEAYISATNSYYRTFLTAFARSVSFSSLKKQEEIFIVYPNGFPFFVNAAGGSNDDFVYSIEGTKDGGYISVGSSLSYNSVGTNVFLVKRDTTIINYPSFVSVKENQKGDEFRILQKESEVELQFGRSELKKVKLLDISGRVLLEQDTWDMELVINVSDLIKGIYFIRTEYPDGRAYSKKLLR